MNSQKGWTRTTKEIILNGSVVKPMERTNFKIIEYEVWEVQTH